MANLGITRYQDLIGRTDLLKASETINNPKAKFLNLDLILKNALHMRPGVNIEAGSKRQVRIFCLHAHGVEFVVFFFLYF